MKKDIDTKLDEVLEISTDIQKETKIVPIPKRAENIDTDYKYGRETLYNLVERGQDAIDGILDLCKETEHPRAYEVAGNLIKNVADVTDKLMILQEKIKKVKEESHTGPKSVTNALYIGSTAELQKLLKDKKQDAINKN